MIKFTGTNDKGEEILGLGLEQGNWDRLLEGKPIVIRPDQIGLPWKGEIVVFAGVTQQDMIHMLSRAGALRDVPVHTFKEEEGEV